MNQRDRIAGLGCEIAAGSAKGRIGNAERPEILRQNIERKEGIGTVKIGGLGDQRDGAALVDGFEERRGALAEAEHAGVIGRAVRLREIAGEIQQRIGAQAGKARAGVTPGFDAVQKRFAGGTGLCGGDKAVFQPFIHAVERGKLGGRCGAQAIEQRLRERFFFVDKAAFFGGSQSSGEGTGRPARRSGRPAPGLRGRRLRWTGRRGTRRDNRFPGARWERERWFPAGLQIFQRQRGVGLSQQIGGDSRKLFGGQRAGAGIGQAVG